MDREHFMVRFIMSLKVSEEKNYQVNGYQPMNTVMSVTIMGDSPKKSEV